MRTKQIERASVALAERTSRRSFIGKLGRGVVALAGGSLVASALAPERAEAYHICGHTFTTDSCPHPFAPLSRVDRHGYPVHPEHGYPVDDNGDVYTSRDQVRRKMCQEVVPERYPQTAGADYGGGWSRCCNGRVRRIADCCSYSQTRINGDASVTGYCYRGTKVFCIGYRDTNVRC
ncbi:MAG: hypothetical protein M3271_09630 [Actinomycetota bacterium]|nr:hypothetical protein [Actinomycetota bacterium]